MNPLDAIEIPVPCQASWEAMKGDDRMRFCGSCRLHVYNLSDMTRKEAEALVTGSTGKVCVRLYRRPDGKVLTRSCRAAVLARRTAAVAFGLVATVLMGFFAWASTEAALGMRKGGVKNREPYRTIRAWITPTPPVPGRVLMGDVCVQPEMGEPVATPEARPEVRP